jgi:predicted dienelactone hydrolase
MQILEALFLLVMAAALTRLIAGPIHPQLRYSTLAMAGAALLIIELLPGGWRWQMLPAWLAFGVLMLAALKKGETRQVWRVLGAVPLFILTVLGGLLAHYIPVVSLPKPNGTYAVGTFNYSITDAHRKERYAPERNRELFVEVWYPADRQRVASVPVRTLYQELYEGDYNWHSLLFGYLKRVKTHSHINAPVAKSNEGKFPVLLFNHGWGGGFTSQNHLLMEYLASHGYVVLSIAHPYSSAKVNLAKAGTVFRTEDLPQDIKLPRQPLNIGIVGKVYAATNDIQKVSDLKALLYPLSYRYVALPDADKAAFLTDAIKAPAFDPFRRWLSAELVEDFALYEYIKDGSIIDYWVKDNQFIADSLTLLKAPVAGFSEALDTQKLGVIGMSYGGATAGEFCKIDARCGAGINLDGTQFGRNWNASLRAPFLMLYHDGHEGGNSFAYLPAATDYWEYRVRNSAHTDFTDFAYTLPILRKLGITGSIDGMRMMSIINTVQVDFLDHYLKGRPIASALHTDIPELTIRKHGGRP